MDKDKITFDIIIIIVIFFFWASIALKNLHILYITKEICVVVSHLQATGRQDKTGSRSDSMVAGSLSRQNILVGELHVLQSDVVAWRL